MNNMNSKLLIKNKKCYVKETHSEILEYLDHEKTFDCVELRFGIDYHYYVLNGRVEGIDIKLIAEEKVRGGYYKIK